MELDTQLILACGVRITFGLHVWIIFKFSTKYLVIGFDEMRSFDLHFLDLFNYLTNENIKSICFYEKPFKSWWEIFYYSIKNPKQKNPNQVFLENKMNE